MSFVTWRREIGDGDLLERPGRSARSVFLFRRICRGNIARKLFKREIQHSQLCRLYLANSNGRDTRRCSSVSANPNLPLVGLFPPNEQKSQGKTNKIRNKTLSALFSKQRHEDTRRTNCSLLVQLTQRPRMTLIKW